MNPLKRRSLYRVLGLTLLFGSLAVAAGAEGPAYLRRLEMPVRRDTIGYPRGVTADPHTEEVFVCDTRNNRILIFDGEGRFLFQISGGDIFSAPSDLAIDPDGFLVVVANHQRRSALIELDFDGLFLGEILLTGLPADLAEPRLQSVALSPEGDRIYALDTVNLRLWITDRDGAIVGSVDLAADYSEKDRQDLILGHVDVYGETVLVAVTSEGQIASYELDGTARSRVGEPGTAPCKLGRPVAAALADNGELVIVDKQRMVILRWNAEGDRCLGEYYGLGNRPGYLYFPMDLALDGAGQLYVTQGYQGRVQMYEGLAPAIAPPRRP